MTFVVPFIPSATNITTLACILVAWLYLVCRMSHTTALWVLKFVDFIINLTVETYSTNLVPIHSMPIPHDIYTAVSVLILKPEIIQYICCLKYFYCYVFENLPEKCTW